MNQKLVDFIVKRYANAKNRYKMRRKLLNFIGKRYANPKNHYKMRRNENKLLINDNK
jgi:hypothetical protein